MRVSVPLGPRGLLFLDPHVHGSPLSQSSNFERACCRASPCKCTRRFPRRWLWVESGLCRFPPRATTSHPQMLALYHSLSIGMYVGVHRQACIDFDTHTSAILEFMHATRLFTRVFRMKVHDETYIINFGMSVYSIFCLFLHGSKVQKIQA